MFRIRGEVAAEGVGEVRSQVPLSRVGPLADLLRLDPEPLQQRGQMARGQGVALGVIRPGPIVEGGQVANDGGRRESVGRRVRFDDGPARVRAAVRARAGPRTAGLP